MISVVKFPLKSAEAHDEGFGEDLDLVMTGDLVGDLKEVIRNVAPLNGVGQFPRKASQMAILFLQ